MAKPIKTINNPYQLTKKQTLVINEAVETVKKGKPLNLTNITKQYYNTKNPAIISNQNFNKLNYRQALIDGLIKRQIIGKDSIIEAKLNEGLDATVNNDKGINPDYKTRLSYIQEIHKIIGIYTPERKMGINLNVDTTLLDIDNKIKQLQQEFNDNDSI